MIVLGLALLLLGLVGNKKKDENRAMPNGSQAWWRLGIFAFKILLPEHLFFSVFFLFQRMESNGVVNDKLSG